MAEKVFSSGRTTDKVAYDLALALASKDPEASSTANVARALASKILSVLSRSIISCTV